MELIYLFIIFLILFLISAVFNIFLKLTKKRDWLITLFISVFLSIIIYGVQQ